MRSPRFLLAVVLVAAACDEAKLPQAEACAEVLDCYFGGRGTLEDVKGFEGLFPSDEGLVVGTYGPTGSCWDDAEIARSCEGRCKALLGQDCAEPFVENADHAPFCSTACDERFALSCTFQGFNEKDGTPRFSSCPTTADCSAPLEIGGEGCCQVPGHEVDTCASQYDG